MQQYEHIKYVGCCICAQGTAVDPMFLLQCRNASEVDAVWLAQRKEGPNHYSEATDVGER